MRDVELLIPASNLEVLKVAVLYGADAVSVHKQTVPTMRHTSSGMIRERAVLYLQENYLWKRSKISVLISQMIWKLNHLFMVLCVSLIPEDAC